MPYKVVKHGDGYKVCKPNGECFSKKPMTKQKAQAQMRAMYANVQETFDQAVDRLLREFTGTGGSMGATTTVPLATSSQASQQPNQQIKNINDPTHLQQVCSSVDTSDPKHLQQACAQFGVDANNPQHQQQVQAVKQGIATYNKKQQPTTAQQQSTLTQPNNTGAKAPVSAPPNVNNPITQPTQPI